VLTALLTVALTAWLGARALLAERHLSAARASLADARTALVEQRLPEARAATAAAGRDTARARSLTSDPIWRAVAAVPVGGRSLRTVAGLARGADDVARSVLPGLLEAADTLGPTRLRRADGAIDLALVRQATPSVLQGADRAADVQADVAALPRDHVLLPVARAREDFLRDVDALASGLAAAGRAVQVAPALLGGDRPRRYFVLVQQTSEARGTGGITGGYVVLEAADGRLRVPQSGSNLDLVQQEIPVPPGVPADYVRTYGGNGAFSLWQNVNLSPDLPVVARVVAARWRAQGGGALDGVIAMDAVALKAVLRGAPPIALSDGRQVPVDQLEEFLAVGQYPDDDDQLTRKDELSQAARVAADRLLRGGVDATLLRGLFDAVRSGHLRMASDDPALSDALRDGGVDGRLPEGPAPVAYPVVVNAAGNKLDYFLERSVAYAAGPCVDGERASSIAVQLRNTAPASGLPPYTTIRSVGGRTVSSTVNEVLLQVYGTRGARLQTASLDGQAVPVRAGGGGPHVTETTESGLPMWQIQLSLPREMERRLVLQLIEPAAAGRPRVPEQPLARPLRRDVRVASCR
jgi:hypothetical protein